MTTEEKALYLTNDFSWFDYQKKEKEQFYKDLLTFDHSRIEKAYEWYINQHYDYMARGEVLWWAIDYIKGERDFL